MPRESTIERECVKLLERAGYETMKAGKGGWPDRLVLLRVPEGQVYYRPTAHVWIEFKQPGGKLTPAQQRRIPKLKERGEVVLIIDHPGTCLSLVNHWHMRHLDLRLTSKAVQP